jgi:hypothetical protein
MRVVLLITTVMLVSQQVVTSRVDTTPYKTVQACAISTGPGTIQSIRNGKPPYPGSPYIWWSLETIWNQLMTCSDGASVFCNFCVVVHLDEELKIGNDVYWNDAWSIAPYEYCASFKIGCSSSDTKTWDQNWSGHIQTPPTNTYQMTCSVYSGDCNDRGVLLSTGMNEFSIPQS